MKRWRGSIWSRCGIPASTPSSWAVPHYPLLAEVIGGIIGPDVTLVDSGAEAARSLKRQLTERELLADRRGGEMTLYASDRPEDFGALAGMFLGQPLQGAVRPVDIEKY